MTEYAATTDSQKLDIKIDGDFNVYVHNKLVDAEFSRIVENVYMLRLGEKVWEITVIQKTNGNYNFLISGDYVQVDVKTKLQEKVEKLLKNKSCTDHKDVLKAPMPGLILKILKNVGDKVELGENLVVLEAMKMENSLTAPVSGKIKEIIKKENSSVEKDEIILSIG